MWPRLLVEDQTLKIEPERGLRDPQELHLRALREDRQRAPLVIEVPELDRPKRALAQPVVEEQSDCETVAQLDLRPQDRRARSSDANRLAVYSLVPSPLNRERRVAVKLCGGGS